MIPETPSADEAWIAEYTSSNHPPLALNLLLPSEFGRGAPGDEAAAEATVAAVVNDVVAASGDDEAGEGSEALPAVVTSSAWKDIATKNSSN